MVVSSRLGDDWFITMAEQDCEKIPGFQKTRGYDIGTKEYDMDSDDVKGFKKQINKFKKTTVNKDIKVFNLIGADFRTYIKLSSHDRSN